MGGRDHVVQDVGAAEARDEAARDVPLHVRSLKQLSRSERSRYQQAMALLSMGGGIGSLAKAGDLPLAGLGVYEALLTRSWAVRFQSREEMVCLAQAAVDVAQRLDVAVHGESQIADLQARAWGELANAHRASTQYRSADHSFGQAYALFYKGTGDLYLKARLFDLEASLLGSWRDFSAAEERLRIVFELYRDLREIHLSGRALIVQALYTFYSGRPEEALQLNKQGKKLIDHRRDHSLFLMAVHNDLLFLVDLGRYSEAKRALFDSRRHFIYQDRINTLRLRGIEGRIEYGLGKLVSAETAFREIKEGFAEAGAPFLAAIACLDLAMVLLSQGRFDEAEKEVLAAQRIFASVEVYREFLGSVVFLEEVFRRRTVTPALIQSTIAQIWHKNLRVGPRHFR